MPKIKTHKATAKRFKRSSKNKLRRVRGPKSHLRRKKSKRVRRQLAKKVNITNIGNEKRVARLAPYLKRKKK